MTQRTDRIDQLLREEIGAVLAREIADPRIGFATITDVETTPDLRHAKVWVSVIGTEPERAETVAVLQGAMGFVQRELGHRLRLKRIPALHVRLDDTADRSTRVMKLLAELDAGTVAEDLPTGETLPTPVPRIRHGDEPEAGDDEPVDAVGAGETADAAAGRPAPRPHPRRRSSARPPTRGPRRAGPRAHHGKRP
jgi:ribosome-binding factor A